MIPFTEVRRTVGKIGQVGHYKKDFIWTCSLQSCPTLCNPMNCSMLGLPVHHQLPELDMLGLSYLGAMSVVTVKEAVE